VSSGNYGYWTFGNGKNGLKGAASTVVVLPDGRRAIVKNPENPAVLEDEFILYTIQHVPKARDDFNRIFPTLLPDEQERLNDLIYGNPKLSLPVIDPQTYADMQQKKDVTAGVRTRMPKPTKRIPG
jgi:hypothetical protein